MRECWLRFHCSCHLHVATEVSGFSYLNQPIKKLLPLLVDNIGLRQQLVHHVGRQPLMLGELGDNVGHAIERHLVQGIQPSHLNTTVLYERRKLIPDHIQQRQLILGKLIGFILRQVRFQIACQAGHVVHRILLPAIVKVKPDFSTAPGRLSRTRPPDPQKQGCHVASFVSHGALRTPETVSNHAEARLHK